MNQKRGKKVSSREGRGFHCCESKIVRKVIVIIFVGFFKLCIHIITCEALYFEFLLTVIRLFYYDERSDA